MSRVAPNGCRPVHTHTPEICCNDNMNYAMSAMHMEEPAWDDNLFISNRWVGYGRCCEVSELETITLAGDHSLMVGI